MRSRHSWVLFSVLTLCLAASGASAQITINEVRTDNTGTDTDEYFELKGTPGASLNNYWYIVIGDGGLGGCGNIESVTNLTGKVIQADGLFCLRNIAATPVLSGYDATDSLAFENSDNVTHMLVTGFTGTKNVTDIDTNNDGIIDVTPWTAIVDAVALVKTATPQCGLPLATDESVYTTNLVGPDGVNVPGHIWKCRDTGAWMIGPFNIVGGQDTPGNPNANCLAPPPSILADTRNVCAPLVGQAVTVTDSIVAATSANLTYSINGGGNVVVAMASIGSNKWQATIPAQAVNGTRVSYFVTATNAQGSDVGFVQGYFVGIVTIASIRAVDGNGVAVYNHYGVNLTGNVTAAQGSYSPTNTDFWFQDATGGMRVFHFAAVLAAPALGNSVSVSGSLGQFNGSMEIESTTTCGNLSVTINGPGSVPAPRLVNTCDLGEATEGLLVRLQYPIVDTVGTNSTGSLWVGNKSYNMSNCSNQSDLLFIDLDTDIDGTPIQSLQMQVTGISGQYDTVTPYLSSYQVMPRALSDIVYVTQSGIGDGVVATKARLFQSTPNPFSSKTTIQYEVPRSSSLSSGVPVRINVFDIAGRKVATLVDETKSAGIYSQSFDAGQLGVSSGIFFYSLEVNGVTVDTRKMVLQK